MIQYDCRSAIQRYIPTTIIVQPITNRKKNTNLSMKYAGTPINIAAINPKITNTVGSGCEPLISKSACQLIFFHLDCLKNMPIQSEWATDFYSATTIRNRDGGRVLNGSAKAIEPLTSRPLLSFFIFRLINKYYNVETIVTKWETFPLIESARSVKLVAFFNRIVSRLPHQWRCTV